MNIIPSTSKKDVNHGKMMSVLVLCIILAIIVLAIYYIAPYFNKDKVMTEEEKQAYIQNSISQRGVELNSADRAKVDSLISTQSDLDKTDPEKMQQILKLISQ